MSSVKQIRSAVKSTLETAIPDLFAYNNVPEVTNVPAAVVEPATADFLVAMGRGADTWEFEVTVLVSYADADVAQDQLDDYVNGAGDKSIRQAIFANRSLGLPDVTAHIAGMSDYGATYQVGDIDYLGAILRLVATTSGTA